MFIVFFLIACQQLSSTTEGPLAKANIEKENEMLHKTHTSSAVKNDEWLYATVKRIHLEGGFYGLVLRNGQKLLPLNLEENFRKHNLVVMIKGSKKKGVITIQQWGTPFMITEVQISDIKNPVQRTDH